MAQKSERQIGGRTLSIETGKLARQANGSVVVRYEDTIVFAAVVTSEPREGLDFFPLTVDYREKLAAAGKFPGGFMKREGRPTLKEILTMRMIDRPMRPRFPKGFRNEVQIQTMVWSADQQNDPDVLAMVGASAALAVSDIPFNGPVGSCRVSRVDGELVVNPTMEQRAGADMEIILSGTPEGINMIELGGQEVPEDEVAAAVEFGHKAIIEICGLVEELRELAGKEKTPFEIADTTELVNLMAEKIGQDYLRTRTMDKKQERGKAVKELFEGFVSSVCPEGGECAYGPELLRMAFEDFEEKMIRDELMQGRRPGDRPLDQIRSLMGEVSVLPRTHGSAIFARGETQAIVTCTLGTADDAQIIDTLMEDYPQRFMLHYNFPPFSVGECRRIGPPSRREIGHGALAERSLQQVLPDAEEFPYTLKLVSDILESNGSSSMASVCGGTLALMDAGVPIKRPVAGISIGMVSEGDQWKLLTDILGEEDHYGDMDFKVAGTQNGITGIQVDLKRPFLTYEQIRATLEAARKARMDILQTILGVIERPRTDLSVYAPKLVSIKIPVELIGKVIGPGGNQVRAIQEQTGANVEIEDDGTVFISCVGGDAHLKAKAIIEAMTRPIVVNKIYHGKVVSTKDFGAFVEIAPGKEGMCHISELADQYVKSVNDVVKVGDMLDFKVIAIDEQGRVKLSRKAVMQEQGKASE